MSAPTSNSHFANPRLATVDDIIDNALKGRRTLLVIVPNIFASDPGKLADWASASHIEKVPRTTPTPTPSTP